MTEGEWQNRWYKMEPAVSLKMHSESLASKSCDLGEPCLACFCWSFPCWTVVLWCLFTEGMCKIALGCPAANMERKENR